MNAIAYLRVSTFDQANKGQSLEAQQAKVLSYAKLYDLQVSLLIKENLSAKDLLRPGLTRALNMLKERKADGLLITKLDRISRNLGDWNSLVANYFGQNMFHLWSVEDHVDTQSAAGRLVLNMLMAVSQWEREIISERTREVLQHKKGKLERTGKVPYGMRLCEDGKNMVIDSNEQIGMKIIVSMRQGGHSYREIAEKLDGLGFKTKSGHPWCHSSVAQICKRVMVPLS